MYKIIIHKILIINYWQENNYWQLSLGKMEENIDKKGKTKNLKILKSIPNMFL